MESFDYHYEEEFSPTDNFETDEQIIEGSWGLRNQIHDDIYPITSMNYDNYHELLWVGNTAGRVTSYMVKEGMQRYSSFLNSQSAVVEIVPTSKSSVISISATAIRMHTDGGLPYATYNSPLVLNESTKEVPLFTCGHLLQQYGSAMSSSEMTHTHMVVGTSGKNAYGYDLLSTMAPLIDYELGASSICCRSSGLYIAIGGGDGKIRLLDGRLRMKKVSHVLDAHTGLVTDCAVQLDDVTLLSCGMSGRAINPYDPTSPLTYSPDLVVRTFDLRMLRQLSPIPLPLANTAHIRFLPASPNSLILFASSDGVIQTYDPTGQATPVDYFYAQLDDNPEHSTTPLSLTSLAVSSSGQLISGGSSSGLVSEFYKIPTAEGADLDVVVNLRSSELQLPHATPSVPMVSLTVDSPVLATAYVLKQKKYVNNHEESLLSSFATTPSVLHQRFKMCSARRISEALLARCVLQDFIGTVTNPGFLPNSMIHGGRVVNNGQTCYAYAVCDPRAVQSTPSNTEALEANKDVFTSMSGLDIRYRKVLSYRGKQRKNQFDYHSLNSTGIVCLENVTANSYANPLLQILYLLPDVRAAAMLAQASVHHHQDQMNAVPTLLCELGFLFQMMSGVERSPGDVPRVVTAANFQYAFQQIPEAVALGLLDSNAAVGEERANKQELQVTVQSFIRFLLHQLQKESEQEMSTSNSSATTKGQGAIDRTFGYDIFCSNHFRQEVDPRGLAQGRTRVRAVTFEMSYPSLSPSTKKNQPASPRRPEFTSFSAVLWYSLRRETSMRGWCSTTESYEPLCQRRCVDVRSLSQVLTITCGDTTKETNEGATAEGEASAGSTTNRLQTYWQRPNIQGGPWVSSEVEIWQIGRPDNIGEAGKLVVSCRMRTAEGADSASGEQRWLAFDGQTEAVLTKPAAELMSGAKYNSMRAPGGDENGAVVRLHLFAMVSQVPDFDSEGSSSNLNSKHLVLHIRRRVPGGDATPHWLLVNDMVSQKTTVMDVFNFHAARQPCVLLFCRDEYELADSVSIQVNDCSVPASVFQLKSLSSVPCANVSPLVLPPKGELVAFDAEFVTVELEKVVLDSQGQRADNEEGRQILARISLIDSACRILADDCVLPTEPVVDYVTRFSGLTEEDLTPGLSRFSVVTHRTAYLKLRHLVDRGCIIVGHGLKKDFETANLFVPPQQIRDTVELWRLPAQRKISLRFLAAYLLQMTIQDEVHDSIEDAKTALALYKHYVAVAAKGPDVLTATLNDLYAYGARTNWTIGMERISQSSESF